MGFFRMIFRQMNMQSLPLHLLSAAILQCFTLNSPVVANEHEQVQITKTLRWQNRLLFARTESLSAKTLVDAWRQEFQAALDERKLQVLYLTSEGKWITPKKEIFSNLNIADEICADCLFLIGLDGDVKFRDSISAESLNKLFDIIDAMPMRRAELN